MLLPGGRDGAHEGESRLLVQAPGRGVAGFDLGDHGAVARRPARPDERRQESGAEAPSPGGGGEVDGVLDRAGVSLVGVPRARDGEADHALAAVPAVPLAALIPLDGDERGPARDLRFQPGDGLVGVLLPLRPDRQGVADGGVADPPDGGGVRDDGAAHERTARVAGICHGSTVGPSHCGPTLIVPAGATASSCSTSR